MIVVWERNMKDIRKKAVKNCIEIYFGLYKESPERAKYFLDKMYDIYNQDLITDFWNLLVEFKKHDKTFGVVGNETPDLVSGFANFWVVALGGLTASEVLSQSGNALMSVLIDLGVAATSVKALVNNFTHLPKAEQIQRVMEAMRIREPELYDIELCFNKVDMEQVKTTQFIGKKAYIEAHKELVKYLKECGIENAKIDADYVKELVQKNYNKVESQEELKI